MLLVSICFYSAKGLINDTDLAIEQFEGYKYKRYQKWLNELR